MKIIRTLTVGAVEEVPRDAFRKIGDEYLHGVALDLKGKCVFTLRGSCAGAVLVGPDGSEVALPMKLLQEIHASAAGIVPAPFLQGAVTTRTGAAPSQPQP